MQEEGFCDGETMRFLCKAKYGQIILSGYREPFLATVPA